MKKKDYVCFRIIPAILVILLGISLYGENERLLALQKKPKTENAIKNKNVEHMDGAEELNLLRSVGIFK